MRSRASLSLRCIASLSVLMLAGMPVAQCGAAAMTPEQQACCAAMKGDCHTSISPHCCGTEAEDLPSFVASRPTVGIVPVAVVVAVLGAPPIVVRRVTQVVDAPEPSSSGPPGVPTYLFVSSFRI